jgi:hypothetical protein
LKSVDAQMATAIANATKITFMFTFVMTMRILYCAASRDRHGGFFEINDVPASAAPRRRLGSGGLGDLRSRQTIWRHPFM